jgi:hypothetical protein
MSCDAQVVRGKIAKIAQHILAKECMIEEVIEDIDSCNVPTSQIWYGLHNAIAKLSSCKLKGRIKNDSFGHYVTIPIIMEFATMIADFLGPVESQADDAFFPQRKENKTPAIITPLHIQGGRHLNIAGRTEGEVTISIGDLSFEDHKILLRVDILDTDVICSNTQIVMTEFVWI